MFISSALAQTDGHAAPAAARVFPPFDTSYFSSHLFWLAVSFGLFYLFMARVVLPRIGGVIELRRDRIASDLDQAARMKEEADAAVAIYEKVLADARLRAASIARTATEEARMKTEAEHRDVEAGLEKKLAESEKRIAEIRDKALQDVGAIAEDTAAELVEKLVGKVDKAAVSKAVQSAGN
ncbi:MAG: ATP synthase subunit B' [Candidatus Tokpelaia hoelldobleri]|uniref:ATP synthase subunit b n=1 Tax=Candidatus Tokpelaia hoelldobleri TaxID=1902579 RepID=A0A1U9JW32_9HYPH|nr:MAG: ATP synthase subunit B' [Candidatus Tokpelaia hoelldoblerii]